MEITLGKYRTYDGSIAYVLADAGTTYDPFVGYIVCRGEGYSYTRALAWDRNGRMFETIVDEFDLMERIE